MSIDSNSSEQRANLSSLLQSLIREEPGTQEFCRKFEEIQVCVASLQRQVDSIPGVDYSPSEQKDKILALQKAVELKTGILNKYKAFGTSVLFTNINCPSKVTPVQHAQLQHGRK